MALSIWPVSYNHHHYIVLELFFFNHSKQKPPTYEAITLYSSPYQPLATTNLLSFSMDLCLVDISYK